MDTDGGIHQEIAWPDLGGIFCERDVVMERAHAIRAVARIVFQKLDEAELVD